MNRSKMKAEVDFSMPSKRRIFSLSVGFQDGNILKKWDEKIFKRVLITAIAKEATKCKCNHK